MSSQSVYTYLVSTLPHLVMTEPLPIPMETVMATCQAFLSPEEFAALESLNHLSAPCAVYPRSINRYLEWETTVRNRLVFLRAYKLGIDPDLYKRPEGKDVFLVEDTVHEIFNLPTYEKEHHLDYARWRTIEFMTTQDHFNFAVICAYKLKCELVEKWLPRQPDNGKKNLDILVKNVTAKVPSLSELSQ